MNFDIRGAVIRNLTGMNSQDLVNLVNDSIQQREEKFLPGLGVLFEVIWKNSPESDKNRMIQTLHDNIPAARS
ncbi:small acid-soluble spore protein SspI [Staphylospora marina]|uniref:small acid-soluble spore protein SspI n=1 Tax=Staphylospora marina TaxID=2490858 RepID=UPI000F5BA22F|nr:small acid-soluble spore protein SspI [Staphylospora marina]